MEKHLMYYKIKLVKKKIDLQPLNFNSANFMLLVIKMKQMKLNFKLKIKLIKRKLNAIYIYTFLS